MTRSRFFHLWKTTPYNKLQDSNKLLFVRGKEINYRDRGIVCRDDGEPEKPDDPQGALIDRMNDEEVMEVLTGEHPARVYYLCRMLGIETETKSPA